MAGRGVGMTGIGGRSDGQPWAALLGLDGGDVREVAELAAEVEPEPDEQLVRRLEAGVADRHLHQAGNAPVQQRANLDRGDAPPAQPADEVPQAEPGADHVLDDEDAAARQRRARAAPHADAAGTVRAPQTGEADAIRLEAYVVRRERRRQRREEGLRAAPHAQDEQRIAATIRLVRGDARRQLPNAPRDCRLAVDDPPGAAGADATGQGPKAV